MSDPNPSRRSLGVMRCVSVAALLCWTAQTVLGQERVSSLALDALPVQMQSLVVPGDPLSLFRTEAVPGGRVDLDSGVLRAAYRIAPSMTLEATPEATARAYLDAESARFGWASVRDMELIEEVIGRYSTHLKFQQTFFGVRVYNRFVKVNMSRAGHPTMVLSGYAPHLEDVEVFSAAPALGANDAAAIAQQSLSTQTVRTSAPELVVHPTEAPRLAWRLVAWPEGAPAEWEVLIDAFSGEIMQLLDQTANAHSSHRVDIRGPDDPAKALQPGAVLTDGTGLVFDPDPVTSAGVPYGVSFVDNSDADSEALNNELVEVSLPGITADSDGVYRLEGPYVVIDGSRRLGGTQYASPPAERDPSAFKYTRSDPAFEAVMAYYHVDKNQRYVQSLDVGRPIAEAPIRINPHGMGAKDQSVFIFYKFALAFGDGGVDDAEDAEVILHEYGHALLFSSAGRLPSVEGDALHEGFADYWAVSYTRGLMEEGLAPSNDWRRIFDWDGNVTWSGRRLGTAAKYPEDTCSDGFPTPSCDIYDDGLVWATTLMQIYDDVGKAVMDRLGLASHGYLSHPATFVDAAEALLQADLDLYGGKHQEPLSTRLSDRGYLGPGVNVPAIAHTPLTVIKDPGLPAVFDVFARAGTVPITGVTVFHSTNGGAFHALDLSSYTINRYKGVLKLDTDATTLAYYVEVRMGSEFTLRLPSGAPEDTYPVIIERDTQGPTIAHSPITHATPEEWPLEITAQVTDDAELDAVWVTYDAEAPDGMRLGEGAFPLRASGGDYVGVFPVDVSQVGSKVYYRIWARDSALDPNVNSLPRSGDPLFTVEIIIKGILASYDFETPRALTSTGSWARGAPTYGAQVAHSGAGVWATDPEGPISDQAGRGTLDFPPVNLTNYSDAYLEFWHWYDFEHIGVSGPGPSAAGILRDGGNVKISLDDGASWSVLALEDRYSGLIENGRDNPLEGEPAFGGYSFGWRRVLARLPSASSVRLRFDVGADGANTETSAYGYAGWTLDDVRVLVDRPVDETAPTVSRMPPERVELAQGGLAPGLTVEAADSVGIESVVASYTFSTATGATQMGDVRLNMDPAGFSTFTGALPIPGPLAVGDRAFYQIFVGDFDGNTTILPSESGSFVIEARLDEHASAFAHARATGLWAPRGEGYAASSAGTAHVSSIVLSPLDLPENADRILLALTHAYDFSATSGGNLKMSVDGGTNWRVMPPQGGYPGTFSQPHAMLGEAVFSGRLDPPTTTSYDITTQAGAQVRLRIDLATLDGLGPGEFWSIDAAVLTYSTLSAAFETPRELALHHNFPDPFRDRTTISYTLPESLPVRVEIYNFLGRRVRVLVDQKQEAATYTLDVPFSGLAPGVYLLRMTAGIERLIEPMVLVR